MECARLKNWHVCWNRGNKLSRSDLDIGYKGKIHTFCISLHGQLKKTRLILKT